LSQPKDTVAAPLEVSLAEMESFFLTITEKALATVSNDVLIAILSGKMRGKLEAAGFPMDEILPLLEEKNSGPSPTQSAKLYRLWA